jgi:hypothetical protein
LALVIARNPQPLAEQLRICVKSMSVMEVDASHTPLQDLEVPHLPLPPFGYLPHAALQRTNGGLPAVALGQYLSLSPCRLPAG